MRLIPSDRSHPRAAAPIHFIESSQALVRLAVRSRGRIDFLDVGRVDLFDADHNHVVAWSSGVPYRLRDGIARLERRLDAAAFLRIHRSTIVRIAAARSLEISPHGRYHLILGSGERRSVGPRYRHAVRALFASS